MNRNKKIAQENAGDLNQRSTEFTTPQKLVSLLFSICKKQSRNKTVALERAQQLISCDDLTLIHS